MELLYRKGKKEDAELVAPLIVAAMGDLAYKFIGTQDYKQACQLFARFVSLPKNQYSFENLYIVENTEEVIGMILAYDGGELESLRYPFLQYLLEKFSVDLGSIDDETTSGEIYLDCISILPKYQGQGIVARLLNYVKKEVAIFSFLPLGLIVEKNNVPALKAYLKSGFEILGEKQFAGQCYWHMQIKQSPA